MVVLVVTGYGSVSSGGADVDGAHGGDVGPGMGGVGIDVGSDCVAGVGSVYAVGVGVVVVGGCGGVLLVMLSLVVLLSLVLIWVAVVVVVAVVLML